MSHKSPTVTVQEGKEEFLITDIPGYISRARRIYHFLDRHTQRYQSGRLVIVIRGVLK